MKYVSKKYEKQLHELANSLVRPRTAKHLGQLSLVETPPAAPGPFPPSLRLCDPPELGWDYTPPDAA